VTPEVVAAGEFFNPHLLPHTFGLAAVLLVGISLDL
jgi:hypothetical protein